MSGGVAIRELPAVEFERVWPIFRALCRHSLEQARQAGFAAMPFNFVVSGNEAAVRSRQRCGSEIVGRLPGAFRHPRLGPVDGLGMYGML